MRRSRSSDVETVKKVIINDVSIFLSTVINLKLPPEGFWLGGGEQSVVVSVPQIRKEIGEEPSYSARTCCRTQC